MRIDLHCHSRWSPDSRSTLDELIAAVDAGNLDALALTDHDAIEGALQLRDRAPFPVIVGEEVKTAEGEIVGLFLRERVPPQLTPEETLRRIHEQGGVAYVPHPFDTVRSGSALEHTALARIAAEVDALEGYNSRCLFQRFNDAAVSFALEHDLPVTAGSDAHAASQVGMAFVELPDDALDSPARFLEALRQGSLHGVRLGALGRLSPGLAKVGTAVETWRRRARGETRER